MEPLKNSLSKPAISDLANAIKGAFPAFELDSFINSSCENIESLELKARVKHIIFCLHQYLPKDFIKTAEIIKKAKQFWQVTTTNDTYSSFAAWPLIDYIAEYGLDQPEIALPLLAEVTELFSAEFAIRPFLINHFEKTASYLTLWAESDNEHLRRLVSEGTRPRLPWGAQIKSLIKSPEVNLPLLETLKFDHSLYVRRSVANHLNDISKDHPELVIQTCKKWLQDLQNNDKLNTADNKKNINWLVKHACRGLIKQGNPQVFPLLGFTEKPEAELSEIKLSTDNVVIGNELNFAFELSSQSIVKQSFVLDYAIHFVKKSGTSQAKVFKLKNVNIKPNEKLKINKIHSLKKITTRTYYPGEHKLDILINGLVCRSASFNVLK